MMSLLTRTKGYFVVICVLMCGFLLTFSWHLLSNTYDSPTLPKSKASPATHLRHFQDAASDPVKNRNSTNSFTKDEIQSLLSQIYELGLSASEVKKKLKGLQRRNSSESSTSHLAVSPHRTREVIPFKESLTHSQTLRDEVQRESVSSREGSRVNSPTDANVIAKLPKDKDSVINHLLVKSDIVENTHKNVIKHDALPVLQDKSVENMHRSNPSVYSDSKKVLNSTRNPDTRRNREPKWRTEPSHQQWKKYLQSLKEQHDLNKTRHSGDDVRRKTDKDLHENRYEISRTLSPKPHKFVPVHDAGSSHRDMPSLLTRALRNSTSSEYVSDDMERNKVTQRPDYCQECFNFEFPIIIDHPKLCKPSNSLGSQSVFILMLISSAPGNYHARTVIRETWGAVCRQPNSTLKCLFVIGQSRLMDDNSRIQLENDHHQDILQIGFKDSYANLTYKTVTSFKWATRHCYSARYIMKTDDDMYINTYLIPIMLQAAPHRKFMGGACWGSSSPNRDTSSKWYVSLKSFHKPTFPPMCSGTGYIMSMDVVRSMLFASRNVPFFHLEDVYVALCLQKYGIMPVNIQGFSNMFQEFGACFYRNSVMSSHQVPPELLEEFWSSMRRCPRANISPAQLYIIMPYPHTE